MKKVILLITLLTLAIASCNREESHIVVTENPGQPQGGAIVVLNTDSVANQKFEDIHLYAFDAEEKMVVHQYYPTPKEQAKDMIQIEGGIYTFVAIVNVGKDFSSATENLPDITLKQLLDYLKQAANDYPNMLTGKANNTIINHQVVRMQIPLSNKIGESKPDIDPDIDIDPDTNEWEEGESTNGDISNPNN